MRGPVCSHASGRDAGPIKQVIARFPRQASFGHHLRTRGCSWLDVGFAAPRPSTAAGKSWLRARRRCHEVLTDAPICRFADCRTVSNLECFGQMTLLVPIQFADADKLQVLRHLDRYRTWRSLDEKRYCLACGRIINGHDIQVVGGTRGTGPLRVVCPTRGCHSIPMDWVIPTDEVLANMSILQNEPAAEQPPPHPGPARVGFGARLRKLARQFRHAA